MKWEYAAAGGDQQREYPWGSTAPGTACPGASCEYAIYEGDYPSGNSGLGTCFGVASIAPVGTATLGAGRWGQLDLAGNMWQWNLDWYAAYVGPCTDCAFLTAAYARVIRGVGYCYGGPAGLLPQNRDYNSPGNRYYGGVGFRCARTP